MSVVKSFRGIFVIKFANFQQISLRDSGWLTRQPHHQHYKDYHLVNKATKSISLRAYIKGQQGDRFEVPIAEDKQQKSTQSTHQVSQKALVSYCQHGSCRSKQDGWAVEKPK